VVAGQVYGTNQLVLKPHYLFQIVSSHSNHAIYRTFDLTPSEWSKICFRFSREGGIE